MEVKPFVTSDVIKLWRHLGKGRAKQFFALVTLTIVVVFAEMVSIGMIVPFITALTNPDVLLDLPMMQGAIRLLGVSDSERLSLLLTVAFVVLAGVAASLRITLLWANNRFARALGVQLRSELYKRVLFRPYEYHIAHNSSQLISRTTEKAGVAINSGIQQVLMLFSAISLAASIILIMTWLSPMAVFALILLGAGYLLAGYLVKGRMRRNSRTIAELQPQAVKAMQEGIGGIRDVILDKSQPILIATYERTIYETLRAGMQNGFLSQLPKPILEVLGIVMIATLAYGMVSDGQETAIPILAAIAFGAQRLLPSLQQVYFSWSSIQGNQVVIAEIVGELREWPKDRVQVQPPSRTPILFRNQIVLQDVSFRYQGTSKDVLKGLNLNIPHGAMIGFVGETGCGKSTLLDLIMGLLEPTDGTLTVDGQLINRENVGQWQANIAHVPQTIFLSDGTIAENIAFGTPSAKVDRERLRRAASNAQIAETIESLPSGYETKVGERGIRLSGGQRQRIGIARALYKGANLIVLDEATSALDSTTETAVMASINSMYQRVTVLMIAHRTSTLSNCDLVFQVKHGRALQHSASTS